MADSKIEWTGRTWNPIRGCGIISPGCERCYAMNIAHRYSLPGMPFEGLTIRRKAGGARWTGEVREVPDKLDEPLSWKAPQTIFVNSMSDLFHESVSREYVAAVFGVMASCPQHTFQVLTKRAELMAALLIEVETGRVTEWGPHAGTPLPDVGWLEGRAWQHFSQAIPSRQKKAYRLAEAMPWPLPNVHLGVSVENLKHGLPRVEHLRRVPAAVRFLSVEPLLEPLGELDLSGIGWLIVGGESGPGARPMDLDWAADLVRQCKAAGVPCFVKQLGSVWAKKAKAKSAKGGDPNEWPEHLRVREFPKLTLAQAEAWSRAQDAAGKGAGARARAMFGGGR